VSAILVLLASTPAARAAEADSWQLLPGPKGPGVDFNCRAILVDPDGVIYVGTRQEGVLRSKDRGLTWETINDGLEGRDIGKLMMGKGGDILLSLAGKDFTKDQRAYRFRPSEGEWTLLPLQVSLCVNFTLNKKGELLAGVGWNGRVYISNDGGDSFEQVFKAPGAIYELVCLPNGDLVAGTEDVGVFRSSDDGRTWESLGKPLATATEKGSGNIQTIAANSKGDIFVGGRVYTGTAGIIRHVQGDEWVFANKGIPATQPAGDLTGRSLLLGSDGNLYALAGTVYRSDDDGQTWTLFNDGLPDQPGMHGHLAEGPDGYLYFSLSRKGLYRTRAPIYTSSAAGKAATQPASGTDPAAGTAAPSLGR
jgi:photosystem II stability/assembly factor-like uncharacterized protein